jgi:hypothetical protein
MDAPSVKAETSMNCPGRFFHYEPLFTSSFSKNLIISEAVIFSKDKSVTNLRFLAISILGKDLPD